MHVATGYGNQTKLFVPRLKETLGHEMSITAFYGNQGGVLNINGIPVYPTAKHPYGQDIIGAHATHVGADVLITLMDIWVVQPENIGNIPWIPWFPIDHEPIPSNVVESLRKATKGITMSQFGQRMAEQAGFDTYYIPHGIDTKALSPMDQAEARAKLKLPADAFIVGMVAANKGYPPRKAFFQNIAAFAALKQKHPDAILYLHTDDGTHGGECVNLLDYVQVVGLTPGKDVFFCDQYMNTLGFDDEYMRAIYSAMDVHLLVSMGEGFGIPNVEAQSCGTPVIVGDWTAMSELCFSGWKVSKEEAEQEWSPFFRAFQWRGHPDAIAERLFAAYEVRGNQDYRNRARAGALRYDVDKIVEKYWKPTLEDIASKIQPKLQVMA